MMVARVARIPNTPCEPVTTIFMGASSLSPDCIDDGEITRLSLRVIDEGRHFVSQPATKVYRSFKFLGSALGNLVSRIADPLGALFLARCGKVATILSILWATAGLAIWPGSWTLPVRAMFSRQLLFTAVDAIPTAIRFAATVGILMIVQAAIWIDMVGVSTDVIAPMLWRFVVREIAPLLACLIVIGRSGIAIGTELATMRAGGEIEVMDSQGVDPMTYLVMPRILSMILSVFFLAIVIAATMVFTGYSVGWFMKVINMPWSEFFTEIARNVDIEDLVFFASKTLIAGGFAGAICCIDGLNVRSAMTEIPLVSSRVGIHALTAVFAISAILSLLFYNRVLIFQIG